MFELTYTKVGDYYIPNPILDEPPELDRFMGKYADLRRNYLRQHRPTTWAALLNSGTIGKPRLLPAPASVRSCPSLPGTLAQRMR